MTRRALALVAALLTAVTIGAPAQAAGAPLAQPSGAPPARSTGATSEEGWTSPTTIAPSRGNPSSVSCPGTTWCLSVDEAGAFQTFNGTSWSARKQVFPQVDGQFHGFKDVSCPTSAFCLAVTTGGYAVYRSGTWTRVSSDHPWDDLDCYSSTRCAIVADNLADNTTRIAFWNGSTLVGETAPAGVRRLSRVSCPTSTICVAAGTNGSYAKAVRATGSTVKVSTIGQGNYGLDHAAVSCVGWTFCLVATDDYSSWRWNGSSWARAGETRNNLLLQVGQLTCTSSKNCFGTAPERVGRWNGSTWKVQEVSSVPLEGLGRYDRALDCASWSMCLMVDARGRYQRWNGSSWSTARSFNRSSGTLTHLSCPSTTRCLATDRYGNAHLFNGTSWSGAVSVLPNGAFVSCASSTWCLLVDPKSGKSRTWTGSWGPVTTFDTANHYDSLACASSRNCFLFQFGEYRRFSGWSWSGFKPLFPATAQPQVTCPTPTSCTAWDHTSGLVSRWNGSTWSAPRRVGLTRLYDVSCTNNSTCLALGESSTGLRYAKLSSGVWTTGAMPTQLSPSGVFCQYSTSCLASDGSEDGRVWRWNGSQWSDTTESFGIAPVDGECVGTWCMVTSYSRAVWTG